MVKRESDNGVSGQHSTISILPVRLTTNVQRNLTLVILLIYILLLAVILITGTLKRPFWVDEEHFYRTIIMFSKSLEKSFNEFLFFIKTYPEMSCPLPFLFFAMIGKLIGFEVWKFRLLMLLISFLTMFVLSRLIWSEIKKSVSMLVLSSWSLSALVIFFLLPIIINPYFIGTSIFIYTDIPALLFLVISMYCFQQRKFFLSGFTAGLGIWCRQYLIFLPIGYFAWLLLTCYKKNLIAFISPLLAFAMIIPLILLWRGPCPSFYGALIPGFHPQIFVYTVITLLVYTLPVNWLIISKNNIGKYLLLGLLFIPLFILFPPQPLPYTAEWAPATMGFFDKVISKFIGQWKMIPYFLLYYVGIITIMVFVQTGWRLRRVRPWVLVFISFFVMNFYGYLIWEKYLLPVLPVVCIILAGDSQSRNAIVAFIKREKN